MLGARGDLEGGRAHGDSSRPRFKEDGKQKMEKEGRKERKEEGGRGDVVSEWANLGAMSDENGEATPFSKFPILLCNELFVDT